MPRHQKLPGKKINNQGFGFNKSNQVFWKGKKWMEGAGEG